jgi:hypothetical protein
VPTLTLEQNLAALTLLSAFYAVTGDVVQCWVALLADPTAGGDIGFTVSLPTPLFHNVSDPEDVIGTASFEAPSGGQPGGNVQANAPSPLTAFVTSTAPNGTAGNIFVHFAYRAA